MAKRWYLDIGRNSGNSGNFVRVYLTRRFYTNLKRDDEYVPVEDPYKNTGQDGNFTEDFVRRFKITFFAKGNAGFEILNNKLSTEGRKNIKIAFKGGDKNNVNKFEKEVYLYLTRYIEHYYDVHYYQSSLGSLDSDPKINWKIEPVLYQDNSPVYIDFDEYIDSSYMEGLYNDGIGTDLVPYKDVPNDTQMFDSPFKFNYNRYEEYEDPNEIGSSLGSFITSGVNPYSEESQQQEEETELTQQVTTTESTSYGEPGEFELCKDLEDPDVPPICPECKPNPSYIEPNIVYHDGSYYNEKTCEYVIVFAPQNGSVQYVTQRYGDDIEKYVMEDILIDQPNLQDETVFLYGLKRLSKDFDKTQINSYFVGPVGELLDINEEPVELPLRPFTRVEWAIRTDTGQVKIKLSVQKKYFELLPQDNSPEPNEDIQAGIDEVEFDATKFYAMVLRAKVGVKVYQKFYEVHLLKARGYLYKVDDEYKKPIFSSEFDSLRRDLKAFRKDLFKLVRDKGYRVNSFESSLPFANNKIDKIKIRFDNSNPETPYVIKAISVKPFGCRYRQIFNIKKNSDLRFNGEKPIFLKDPRGFTFNPFAIIGNINDVDDDLQAYEPPSWEQFFVKYLVPSVDLEYGTLNSPLEDRQNSLACAMEQFPSFGEFLKSSLFSLETVFELLAYEFNRMTCAEDTKKAIAEFNERYGDKGGLVDQLKDSINPNSGIASYLVWALGSDMNGKEIIGSLTFCELDGLLRLILECMLGGIPFEEALQKIVQKLISSLTARHIGKLIGFLPASQQAEIEAKVQGIIGAYVPDPWSSNFAGGVVQDSKPSSRYKNMKGVSSVKSDEETDDSSQPEVKKPGESTTYALVTQDLAGATPEQVEQMNVDSKVSQVTTVILEAYIEALMDVVPIDDLIRQVDRLPITPLIRTLIVAVFNQCQVTPFSTFADLGMLIPKFKIDVCDPMLAVRIPKIPTLYIPAGIPDLMNELRKMLVQIALSVFTKMLLSFLLKILAALDNILCQGLAALARDDGDFADIFGNLLCGSQPDKTRDMLKEMVESMRGMPPSLAGDCVDCILKSFSRTLSKKEMLMIAAGDPVDISVFDRVANSISLTCSDCSIYFPDGNSVSDLCKTFPAFLPESERRKAQDLISIADDSPICDLVCLNKQQLDDWDALRRNELEDMGLSPEAAAEEIDKLNDIALQEFDDMLSAGVGLQDIIADEYDKLLNRPEQCDEPSPWNTKTKQIANFASSVAEYIFTPIEMEFYREMTGKRKSVLSRVLSDTRGNTYNAHRFFASSIFSRWYYKDFDEEDTSFLGIKIDTSIGHFPETIGEDLRSQFVEPEEEIEYNTNMLTNTKQPEIIEVGGIEVLSHYNNSKRPDYSFRYERTDDIEYTSNTSFINSINTVLHPYEPLENFGYTISSKEDKTPIVFEKIDNSILTPDSLTGNKPYAVKYFDRHFTSITLVNSSRTDNIYDNMFNSLFQFINKGVISGDGFVYGATSSSLDESDIQYLNPEGGEYNKEEEQRILGKSGHPRVIFLDPKIHGGSYTKPKIYIKPEVNKGWLSLYDAFSNYDPVCDDIDDKILPFNDIIKYHDSLLENLPIDKRLYQEPECRKDIPFDRVFSTETAALVDAIVKTTVMCYAVDMSINVMPILLSVKWKPENYDSMFSQILFKKIKSEMINEVGRSRTKNNKKIRRHRYWCLFLEQVAQSFQRQVDMGMIQPTEAEEAALREIFLVRKRYKYPDREDIKTLRKEDGVFNMNFEIGDFANFKLEDNSFQNPELFYKYALAYDEYQEDLYNEVAGGDATQIIKVDNPRLTRLKRFRLQTKIFAIRTVEDSVRVLFDRIVFQEMDRYLNKLQDIVPPKINDIRHYMFHQNNFFIGSSLSIGTTSSEELYSSGQRTGFGEIIEPEYDTDIFDSIQVSEDKKVEISEKGCLIVERYVNIQEKTYKNRETLTPNQRAFLLRREIVLDPETGNEKYYGIVKLKDFREYVRNTQLIHKDKNLSHYFGGDAPANFGIRISYVFPDDYEDYEPIGSNERRNKLMKTYKRGDKIVQPLASFEHPFIDETIETFLSQDSVNNYDNHCLVKNLVKTEDFIMLFEKMLPVKAPLSVAMATLYTSFYNSIGANDGWDGDRGKNDADQFENVEKGALKNTKKLLQKAFESAYKDQEFDEEESREHKNSMFGFLKNMIPDLRLNLGKFGNRVVRDIDDCDDPVFKLLRK